MTQLIEFCSKGKVPLLFAALPCLFQHQLALKLLWKNAWSFKDSV